MSDEVIVAIIGAIATVLGVILTNRSMLEKQSTHIDRDLAVFRAQMNERVDELTREVREHNQVLTRVYTLEAQQQANSRRIEVLEHQTRPSA